MLSVKVALTVRVAPEDKLAVSESVSAAIG